MKEPPRTTPIDSDNTRQRLASSALKPTVEKADEIAAAAVTLAAELVEKALRQQTKKERTQGQKLSRLMDDPNGKSFTFAMVDEVFRSHDPVKQGRRFRRLLNEFGMPHYPPMSEQMLMKLGAVASEAMPGLVMPQIAKRMRAESSRVIVDGDPAALQRYLAQRSADGFRINLNHLGEAVLGEQEASNRLEAILGHLANPQVNYISVKISAIFSQINLLAWDDTLKAIKDRLRRLYRAALPQHKFVNLDMEEYRDLALTLAAFREILDEPEFTKLSAGVVLQAYLPDSWQAQRELTEWAKSRISRGGADIKLRLVKGANLAMEATEAELHDWNQAPYSSKADTDANFRRMLEIGCRAENAAAVRLGVATHNVFDAALAMVLRERNGTQSRVELEMLEGMANHQARAVRDQAGGLLLYAPAVQQNDFLSALAYLVRRLDENTAKDNFLRDMFGLHPGTPAWEHQRENFVLGWNHRDSVSTTPRRANRSTAKHDACFNNEPDSDWTQLAPRDAVWSAIKKWSPEPLPSLPALDRLLERAKAAQLEWEQLGAEKRARILTQCAEIMAAQRFDTIACMRINAKKAIPEADAEVSEAIDFARYYAVNYQVPSGLTAEALGIVVVTPPWNFPYAIPCGGVLAALMAGNSVVLKPAPETADTAWLLARQLWEGGVPRDVLQFFPCADGETGRALITDPRIACVVLTGAYETARMFQSWRPDLPLLAETSGKNALLISVQADRELAIKDLVKSAFGHAGQKCSAASLAIVEAEVYDDPVFRRQLRDAAASLAVGPSSDPRSVVTPLIRAPGDNLRRALTTNDLGEEWLLEPHQVGDDPCLWSPGIKLGVKPGSWFHLTECFGPVLGIMRANSFEQAIEWQNATDYGLTAGLHSLDPAEQTLWRERVQAGNLYINRPTTGAVVQRQPFGGWKRSCIGPGAKAGGPNYVLSFCHLTDVSSTDTAGVEKSYREEWAKYFATEHDPSGLRCESNVFRFRRCRGVVLRLASRDMDVIARAQLAARLTDSSLAISIAAEENDEAFAARLAKLAESAEFLRTIETPSATVLKACHSANLNWINAPITASGRAELRFWLREQSVSQVRHRYGQIPEWIPPTRNR